MPPEQDHFERLGLPRRFSVDAGALERAYLERSRAVHPDYHLARSDSELVASLEVSAALNESYAVVKDPFARAGYLLALGDAGAGGEKLPPAFLAEMLEVRERIEASRGNPGAEATLKAEFDHRLAALAGELSALFSRLESLPPDDEKRANLRADARGLLSRAKYVRRLIEDLHTA